MRAKIIFIAGLLISISPIASPPLALALGVGFGLIFAHPFQRQTGDISKILLQVCVVGLGFGMNLNEVIRAGTSGFLYTALSIAFAMIVGLILGKLLKVAPTNSFLISVGTAICGGSAIAAIAPVVRANDEEMSVSLGTVFVLNSVALIAFPLIGTALNLTQTQFGLWAALAIHDTSSVVGAGAKYGVIALSVGTTVKLARALWIVPMTFGTAFFNKSNSKIKLPYFIGLFVVAALLNTYLPSGAFVYSSLADLAKIGLTVTLYLIGSNISLQTLKTVGARPMIQGFVLWIIVATLSLFLICENVIAL